MVALRLMTRLVLKALTATRLSETAVISENSRPPMILRAP
nr:TPA_asm: m87.5 uORF RNA *1 [Murid betaherpesvirus 1]DBA08032.1 TPA_asm: m87.5 uORF RNA *1 [Murid betaherpesvirus 1]